MKKKESTQMCIFLVRYYSGIHLGPRRFEIAENLAERSLSSWYAKAVKERGKSNRKLSQTSISSVVSQCDLQDGENNAEDE